jgi:hypothetical protein
MHYRGFRMPATETPSVFTLTPESWQKLNAEERQALLTSYITSIAGGCGAISATVILYDRDEIRIATVCANEIPPEDESQIHQMTCGFRDVVEKILQVEAETLHDGFIEKLN